MPGDVVLVALLVLPAVVLPLISRHVFVLPTEEPESTRMPARAAFVVIGAATALLRPRAVMVLLEARTIGKMPGPSVPITLLPEISVEWVPAPRSFGSSVPTAMPAHPTALLALMKLFWTGSWQPGGRAMGRSSSSKTRSQLR
jgi:hypothetical protein